MFNVTKRFQRRHLYIFIFYCLIPYSHHLHFIAETQYKNILIRVHCLSILGHNTTGGEQSYIWRTPQLWGHVWRSLWLVSQPHTQLLQLRDELLQSRDTVLQLAVDLTCGHICVHLLEEGAEEKNGKQSNEVNHWKVMFFYSLTADDSRLKKLY